MKMKLNLWILLGFVAVGMVACDSENEDVISVVDDDPVNLEFFPKFISHESGACSSEISFTASRLTVDSIRFDDQMTPINITLESGDSMRHEWLKLKMQDRKLIVETDRFSDSLRAVEFSVYCSGDVGCDSFDAFKGYSPVLGEVIYSILPDPDSLVVSAGGGRYHITTQTQRWHIDKLTVGARTYGYRELETMMPWEEVYDPDQGALVAVPVYRGRIDWLYLERDYSDIWVEVDANDSAEPRKFELVLARANEKVRIKGVQNGAE